MALIVIFKCPQTGGGVSSALLAIESNTIKFL
jgi:hypothetical protein